LNETNGHSNGKSDDESSGEASSEDESEAEEKKKRFFDRVSVYTIFDLWTMECRTDHHCSHLVDLL
jgi:hypothetical protein